MKKTRVQRNIYFPPKLIELGMKKADFLGMSFNEWIKYLVTKEVEASVEPIEANNINIDPNRDIALEKLLQDVENSTEKDYPDLPY